MATVLNPSRYSELCRLCASKTTLLLGVHIFQNDGLISQLHKKIESCLPIQVHETDELPKIICENCLYKVNLLSEFRERSVRTERLLIDLVKETKIQHSHQQQQQHPNSINYVTTGEEHLIMVESTELLGTHIGNCDEIGLQPLNNRQQMIVGHEIILAHQNVEINEHSLTGIDLNHPELTAQDISNHSLHPQQDSILVQTGGEHGIVEDNLELMHHQQLLNDQFRLQDDLNVNLNEGENVDDINLGDSLKMRIEPSSDSFQLSEEKSYHSLSPKDKLESLKGDESSNSLLLDDPLKSHDIEKVYVTQNDVNSTNWLYCNICGKNFETEQKFDSHYSNHFQKCEVCFAVFTNSEVLKCHKREAHANTEETKEIKTRLKLATLPIKRTSTDQNSNDDDEFSEEAEINDDPGEDDENELKITADEKVSVKKKSWIPKICAECGKMYKTNYKLNEHMRKHTGEKPYKCDNCDKEFRSKIGLAQHAAKHTGKYDFFCPTCGKGFQCKSYLMVHQRVHSDLKPYPCTTCGRHFKTKQSLLDHTNRHLGVKPYMCDICGRGFITKGLCKAHQKVHTGLDNRKYSCKVCNKMFVSKSYLQTHLRIHTGEKPFICEVCGKGFLTKVDLRIHTTMHTGEKSYVCEMCGKAFARRDALRCHRRSHTGERPYSCDLCGQTFTQFTPMAIHKRLHTGERPYACETCGKTFVSRSTMMSHAKKHLR